MLMHEPVTFDTYGEVKRVEGTSVVTEFLALLMIPAVPLRSYYKPPREVAGRFSFSTTDHLPINALPMRSVDRASAFMAYARGMLGAATIFAFFALLFDTIGGHRHQPALDRFFAAVPVAFGVGLMGVALSYLVPVGSGRDRAIRRGCAEVLGIAVDPARLAPSAIGWVEGMLDQAESSPFEQAPSMPSAIELVRLRRGAADPLADRQAIEAETDELLERLRIALGPAA